MKKNEKYEANVLKFKDQRNNLRIQLICEYLLDTNVECK